MITPWSSPIWSAPAFPVLSSGPQQALDRRGPDLHRWPTTPRYPGTGSVTRPVTNVPADHGGSVTKRQRRQGRLVRSSRADARGTSAVSARVYAGVGGPMAIQIQASSGGTVGATPSPVIE